MKRLFILLWTITSAANLNAQSLILQNYIDEGIASNLSLKQQNLELEKSLKGIEIARSNYFPRVNFAPTYSVAFGGRKINIPIGDLLNPVYSTLNQLTGSNAFPQVENASEQLAPMNFHDTKLEVKIPLFNTDIKYNIALQKDLLNTEEAKKKFLEYELRHNIEVAYYQYLQSLEAIKIFDNSIKLLQSYVDLNKKLVLHEEALKDVVLSAEYELSKVDQQKTEAEKNQTVAKGYFNFLLNRDLSETVIADTNLIKNLPPFYPLPEYVASSLQNRPEFEQLNSGIRTNQTLIQMQEKNALLPQVFLGSNLGFQGFGYTFRNQGYAVGQLGLNWQIFNAGEKKMKIQQTKISGEILNTKVLEVKKQVEMQVFQKYHELQSNIANLKNKESDLARTETIFKLVNSRYKNGSAIFLEINKAQNDYLVSQLSQSLSQLDIWLKYAELKKVAAL
jgi:outer membrane protein